MTHFAGFPKTLRIGVLDIAVVCKDEVSHEDEWGTYLHHKQRIELKNDQPSRVFALDTVLHEILHALFRAADLRCGDDEERVTVTMATGMVQVLRDNPDLFRWIAGALK